MAATLISAPWIIELADAACDVVTIKVPQELVGKDPKAPLALKDGEYLIGSFKTTNWGTIELYTRVQKGEWVGNPIVKVLGLEQELILDEPPPPEVEKCIKSKLPVSGLLPRWADFFLPPAEAHFCGRCVALMTTTNCFRVGPRRQDKDRLLYLQLLYRRFRPSMLLGANTIMRHNAKMPGWNQARHQLRQLH